LHFTAFHPDWKMMDTPATPPATLKTARRIALEAGLRYVYTGNIHDGAGPSTYCPSCGAAPLRPDLYALTAVDPSPERPPARPRTPVAPPAARPVPACSTVATGAGAGAASP